MMHPPKITMEMGTDNRFKIMLEPYRANWEDLSRKNPYERYNRILRGLAKMPGARPKQMLDKIKDIPKSLSDGFRVDYCPETNEQMIVPDRDDWSWGDDNVWKDVNQVPEKDRILRVLSEIRAADEARYTELVAKKRLLKKKYKILKYKILAKVKAKKSDRLSSEILSSIRQSLLAICEEISQNRNARLADAASYAQAKWVTCLHQNGEGIYHRSKEILQRKLGATVSENPSVSPSDNRQTNSDEALVEN